MTTEALESSKTFCMMPWVHLHVTQTGFVTPCCQAPWEEKTAFGSVNKTPIDEIWNGKEMRRFRKNMLKGKADIRCKDCYEKESQGFQSLRNVTNTDYAHKVELVNRTSNSGFLPDIKPVYLDIRFSNICNFKCRICGPWSSSQWHNDAVALGMKQAGDKAIDFSIEEPGTFWQQIEQLIPELEEIYFAGGEPLIMEEHYQLLDLLHKHKKFDLTLKYNTNLSGLKFKNRDVLELWKPFRKIIIAASLDGSGKRGEYQRKNQKWEQVLEIRHQLKAQGDQITFLISPTLNVFNVLHLPDFHREWVNLGLIETFDFIPSLLRRPPVYDISILPQSLKKQAITKIEAHLKWLEEQESSDEKQKQFVLNQWRGGINRMRGKGNPELLKQFVDRTQKLDEIREENFVAIFPELAELF